MEKTDDEAHGKSICGARNRRGLPCGKPPLPNGRCRFHGGLSTGPRTPEGLARSRRATWRHGRRSREARETRRQIKHLLKQCRATLAGVV